MIAGSLRRRKIEETSMKKIALAAVSGVALLGLASFANAQGTGMGSGSTGATSNQCWDVSSNMARDKSQTSASGTSSSGSSGSTVGSTSGAGTNSGTTSSGTGSSSTASARPAGMP